MKIGKENEILEFKKSFGTGLKRITAACKAAKVKISFQMLKTGFAVVFFRPENMTAMSKKEFLPQRPYSKPAIYAYEDASLEYTGINKHEHEAIGLYDTVLSQTDYKTIVENVSKHRYKNVSDKSKTIYQSY